MGSYVRRARMGDGEVREPHLSECKGSITLVIPLVIHGVGICLSLTGCVRSQKAKFYWVYSVKWHPDLKVGIKELDLVLDKSSQKFDSLLHQQGRTRKKGFFWL